ncbi:hypothetical protein LMG27177_05323 [Paraburkholderia fynbosensis]|uniref:Uncharacterized protein n=1 Tax=Paraburkholderia fynbosensis TaxID=1200993 RepID=A0A6J5GM16_9BURK|nr:hypothetical protein LMG27177_05323 [Paraburkholderia fynbosensis]
MYTTLRIPADHEIAFRQRLNAGRVNFFLPAHIGKSLSMLDGMMLGKVQAEAN